jgi:hypothetical protein
MENYRPNRILILSIVKYLHKIVLRLIFEPAQSGVRLPRR